MTFRPTDDVLESMENWQQSLEASNQNSQISNESTINDSWSRVFSNPNAEDNNWNIQESENTIWDSSVEEVKAPDLSELLEKSGEGSTNQKELKPNTLQDIFVPIPPIEEQKRICNAVQNSYGLIKDIEDSINWCRPLYLRSLKMHYITCYWF